jgi:hypothetical protein
MLYQPGVGSRTNAPQQDEIMVILICDDLEVIPGRDSPARPDGFGYYKLATLADVSRHVV